MKLVPPLTGLCLTCAKAGACTFPRNQERPVLFCDEFEGIEGPDTTFSQPLPQAKRARARKADEPLAGHVRGLCRTCENLRNCTYPKPEGGVWHCDEYK